MKNKLAVLILFFAVLASAGCKSIVVNSLEDISDPPEGTITLRSALASAKNGQRISFDAGLDGGTIALTLVGEDHTLLKGEYMGMRDEPSGPVSFLIGYFDRDYGKSALYAKKNVVIDASELPSGITFAWAGDNETHARVLAVYGNLTMTNVSVTGGRSMAAAISPENPTSQPYTLARGGGVAVWGTARLTNCRVYNNYCQGDFGQSRDRGAFGGGLYANSVELDSCVFSGNAILGAGAAGGGVFSVGGAGGALKKTSTIQRCAITGNRISGLFTYGGGVYSDGGGIGNLKTLALSNCTIARNIVDAKGLPAFLLSMGYWRGGGVYMSNGFLHIKSCTIVENQTHGQPRTDDLGKANLAGGIAATIGNAHAVETMTIGHSIIAGNTVHPLNSSTAPYNHDVFTGSLRYFKSEGNNRIGVIDFSQMLVPVGEIDWASLCRIHFPKSNDETGIEMSEVLDVDSGISYSDAIVSVGVGASGPAVLNYQPRGNALNQIPASYWVGETLAEYAVADSGTNNFLEILLVRIEAQYGLTGFAAEFTDDFETFLQNVDLDNETAGFQSYTDPEEKPITTLADTQFFGPAVTWPQELSNYPYIEFWHQLYRALEEERIPGLGQELLGDDAWEALFTKGPLAENTDITLYLWRQYGTPVRKEKTDQLGNLRPEDMPGDIGAIESW